MNGAEQKKLVIITKEMLDEGQGMVEYMNPGADGPRYLAEVIYRTMVEAKASALGVSVVFEVADD